MSVKNECLVLNIQIGTWMGRRLDKELSHKLTVDHNAQDGAARVNKHLVSESHLKPIQQAAGMVRQHFYGNTLPWKDNGDRLITRLGYIRFMGEHGELVQKFQNEVDHFVTDVYPKALDEAEFRMGSMFRESDYPLPREIAPKFYINLDVDTVSEAADFRVDLNDEAAEADVRDRMEGAMKTRLATAMGHVWKRLSDTLENFSKSVGNTESFFRDAAFDNLHEVIDLLAEWNVTGDPNLEAVRQELEANLRRYEPKDARKNNEVRTALADEANRILENMSGFMKAFTNA